MVVPFPCHPAGGRGQDDNIVMETVAGEEEKKDEDVVKVVKVVEVVEEVKGVEVDNVGKRKIVEKIERIVKVEGPSKKAEADDSMAVTTKGKENAGEGIQKELQSLQSTIDQLHESYEKFLRLEQ